MQVTGGRRNKRRDGLIAAPHHGLSNVMLRRLPNKESGSGVAGEA